MGNKRRKVETSGAEERVVEKKQKRIAGRRGALEYIKEFPLDVLFEIFGYLEPYDLLRLARTSKQLRDILMSRSSASIWRTSRENAGVPDLVVPMSEPAFAHLLFDSHCHFCETGITHTVVWHSLLRCCKKCLKDQFAVSWVLISKLSFFYEIKDLIPCYMLGYGAPPIPQWRRTTQVYLSSAANALHSEYDPLEPEAKLVWIEEKKKERALVVEQARKCQQWQEKRSIDCGTARDNARQERYKAICDKLKELDWEEELADRSNQSQLRQHKLVNQTRPLTARIWNNVKGPLIQFMGELKEKRLLRERLAVSEKRYKLLPDILRQVEQTLDRDLIMPSPVEVALWTPFRTVIEDVPAASGVDRSLFDAAITELPQLLADWKQERTNELLELLRKRDEDATEDDLCLATSLFRCTARPCARQNAVYAYPAVLAHRCANSLAFQPTSANVPRWMSSWTTCPHDRKIELDALALRMTERVCELENLDASTITAEEMLNLDPIVKAKSVASISRAYQVMRWSSVITRSGIELTFASNSEKSQLINDEEKGAEWRARNTEPERWYRCNQCNFRDTLSNVKNHLSEAHQIDPEEVKEEHWEFYPLTSITEQSSGHCNVFLGNSLGTSSIFHDMIASALDIPFLPFLGGLYDSDEDEYGYGSDSDDFAHGYPGYDDGFW